MVKPIADAEKQLLMNMVIGKSFGYIIRHVHPVSRFMNVVVACEINHFVAFEHAQYIKDHV